MIKQAKVISILKVLQRHPSKTRVSSNSVKHSEFVETYLTTDNCQSDNMNHSVKVLPQKFVKVMMNKNHDFAYIIVVIPDSVL